MTLYHEIVQMRAGATPYTFDGNQTARFNDNAVKLVAMDVSASLSTPTTDEAVGLAIQLSGPNFTGNRYFPAGFIMNSGPTTNASAKGFPSTIIPLDIPVGANTTMSVNISNVIGATQTGTWDVTIDFIYDDGKTPQSEIDVIRFANNSILPVAVKGGTFNFLAALTVTAETAFDGNATAESNIPADAKEVVAEISGIALDTAITAALELTGFTRHELGITEATDQRTVWGSHQPGLGTEVDGYDPFGWSYHPMYVKVIGNTERVVRQHANSFGVITGGADLASFLMWR